MSLVSGVAILEKFLINLLKNYARPKKDYIYLTVVGVGHLRTAVTFESYTLTLSIVKSNLRNEVFYFKNQHFFKLQ